MRSEAADAAALSPPAVFDLDGADAGRDRMRELSDAIRRIGDALSFESVLQLVIDSARALVGAHLGVITVVDKTGAAELFLSSGTSHAEHALLSTSPNGVDLFEHFSKIEGSLQIENFDSYRVEKRLPEFEFPVPIESVMLAPIRRKDHTIGAIYMASTKGGSGLGAEDQAALDIFASQAALIVENARRRRDADNAHNALRALIDTSPVGVLVFDPSGDAVMVNREALRIVKDLHSPDEPPARLLEIMTIRREDGQEISLLELPLAQILPAAEIVRGERIEMTRSGGRSLAVSINATPMTAPDGSLESVIVTMAPLGDQGPNNSDPLTGSGTRNLERLREELRSRIISVKGSTTTLLESLHRLDRADTALLVHLIDAQATQMTELVGRMASAGQPGASDGATGHSMSRERVLIVPADARTRHVAFQALTSAGFEVVEAADTAEAAERAVDVSPRTVLVELGADPGDSNGSLAALRGATAAPIIVMADHARPDAVHQALDAGATDYIATPFSASELLARVRVARSRTSPAPVVHATNTARVGDCTIDLDNGAAWVRGEPVRLSRLERRLLRELASDPDRTLSHSELAQRVWGDGAATSSAVVRSTVKRLRGKLGDASAGAEVVVTVPRRGYRIGTLSAAR